MAEEETKILIVDDHPIVRDSLKYFLAEEPGFEVVGTAENADRGYEAALETRPDVILLDIEMPGMSPFEMAKRLSAELESAHVLILSAYLSDTYLESALSADASGYVVKNSSVGTIVEAIRSVHHGDFYCCPTVQKRFPGGRLPREPEPGSSRLARLTPREIEILRYVAKGLPVKRIAETLSLSARTVDRHKANIMDKLGIHNQVGLTRYAFSEGLCDIRTVTLPPSGGTGDDAAQQ